MVMGRRPKSTPISYLGKNSINSIKRTKIRNKVLSNQSNNGHEDADYVSSERNCVNHSDEGADSLDTNAEDGQHELCTKSNRAKLSKGRKCLKSKDVKVNGCIKRQPRGLRKRKQVLFDSGKYSSRRKNVPLEYKNVETNIDCSSNSQAPAINGSRESSLLSENECPISQNALTKNENPKTRGKRTSVPAISRRSKSGTSSSRSRDCNNSFSDKKVHHKKRGRKPKLSKLITTSLPDNDIPSVNSPKHRCALRKFASVNPSSPSQVSSASVKAADEKVMPKADDFITFLCFRNTPCLPRHLEFFNNPPWQMHDDILFDAEDGHSTMDTNYEVTGNQVCEDAHVVVERQAVSTAFTPNQSQRGRRKALSSRRSLTPSLTDNFESNPEDSSKKSKKSNRNPKICNPEIKNSAKDYENSFQKIRRKALVQSKGVPQNNLNRGMRNPLTFSRYKNLIKQDTKEIDPKECMSKTGKKRGRKKRIEIPNSDPPNSVKDIQGNDSSTMKINGACNVQKIPSHRKEKSKVTHVTKQPNSLHASQSKSSADLCPIKRKRKLKSEYLSDLDTGTNVYKNLNTKKLVKKHQSPRNSILSSETSESPPSRKKHSRNTFVVRPNGLLHADSKLSTAENILKPTCHLIGKRSTDDNSDKGPPIIESKFNNAVSPLKDDTKTNGFLEDHRMNASSSNDSTTPNKACKETIKMPPLKDDAKTNGFLEKQDMDVSSSNDSTAPKKACKESSKMDSNATLSELIPTGPCSKPVEQMFKDPFKFLEQHQEDFTKYGVYTITPPNTWRSPSSIHDDIWFSTKTQHIHRFHNRCGPSSVMMHSIRTQFERESGIKMEIPQMACCELDLPRILDVVSQQGGIQKIAKHNKWKAIADQLGLPKHYTGRVTKLEDIYLKLILPFDTLPKLEKRQIKQSIQKDGSILDNEPVEYNSSKLTSLVSFHKTACNSQELYARGVTDVNSVEESFWEIVLQGKRHIGAISGQLETSSCEPSFQNNRLKTGWNLTLLPFSQNSALRHAGPVPGKTPKHMLT